MEQKTKVHAQEGKNDLTITRDFDLPVELLFKAHADAAIFERWMSHEYGTVKLTRFENKKYGGFRFETSGPDGTVLFSANGVFHDFTDNQKITRTFEMENTPFDPQIEYLVFEKLSDSTSRLTMHSIFKTGEQRDMLLSQPFAQGLNMAHNRLQNVLSQLN